MNTHNLNTTCKRSDVEHRASTDATDAAIDEFVNKQLKACGWLVPSISSKLDYLVPNEPVDPAVIWNNLSDHSESKSAFNVFHLQNQLAQLKLDDRVDPETLILATR